VDDAERKARYRLLALVAPFVKDQNGFVWLGWPDNTNSQSSATGFFLYLSWTSLFFGIIIIIMRYF